jgi:hypothetical protein
MKDKPLTEDDFTQAAGHLGCEVAAIKAVAQVESGRGAFNPDGSPTSLFEGHVFSRLTQHRFDLSHPDLSYPRWTRAFYGQTWEREQERLRRASNLNYKAAMMATSWGAFQIMGFNYGACGFLDVYAFVTAMHESASRQLEAFVAFIEHSGLADELRERRWSDFARIYNGPGYALNRYDVKLAAAYHRHSA